MAEDDATGSKEGAAGTPRDASLRVDPRTLPAADQDFARMMGFGEEGTEPAPAATQPIAPVVIEDAPASESEDASGSASTESIADEPAAEDTIVPQASDAADSSEAEPGGSSEPGPQREWDEIHPRPATLGRQSALIERAERVLALPPSTPAVHAVVDDDAPAPLSPSTDGSIWQDRLRASESRIAELESERRSLEDALEIARREAAARPVATAPPTTEAVRSASPAPSGPAASADGPRASELEKELERLRGELDGLLLERQRLEDELSVARAARAEAGARAERLEAAYRSARGPHGPVPEGERELRAEVVGLRRRLEESGSESRRLREALDASATELAIARAHADDRQQELEQQRDQIQSLERDRASQIERLDESLARQRELLALVARVQAENVELRSTQAALEETLEARDLEISAREEHLLVTRRGLAARDAQLIDAEERLEQERHRRELVETELERARLAHAELAEGLTRRDARIATLSTTLARVEDAIGRPLSSSALRAEPSPAEPAPGTKAAHAERATSSDEPAAEALLESPSISSEEAEASTAAEPAAPTTDDAGLPALPLILVRWRDAQLAAACGAEQGASVADFLARRLAAHAAASGATNVQVASLGGARPEAELELVRAYRALDVGGITVAVVDRTPTSAETRRRAVDAAGFADAITVEPWADAERVLAPGATALLFTDAFAWADQEAPDAVPAATLVDRMASALEAGGIVLWAGRLAGGGVTISETTSEKLAELWQVLPEAWTGRPGFETPPGPGDDGGTPACAPDPLAALLDRFRPAVCVGLGHVADLFLGPARGFDLSEAGSAAETLLASIDAIDESRSILESLPARHGVGVLVPRTDDAAPSDDPAVESIGLTWPEPNR